MKSIIILSGGIIAGYILGTKIANYKTAVSVNEGMVELRKQLVEEFARKKPSYSNCRQHNFEDVIFETKVNAEEVLNELSEILSNHGSVSVGDFLNLAGIYHGYLDTKHGWTCLNGAYIMRCREGYSLNLPDPKRLNEDEKLSRYDCYRRRQNEHK